MLTLNVVVSEVVSHKALNSKTFVLSDENGKALPSFRAGQYVSVKMKIGTSYVSRPYSICSSPAEALKGIYKITVQDNPQGFAAGWMLENLKKGSKLEISYPHGIFYYKKQRDCNNVIALAGGSGVTPFLSMAQAIRDGLEDFNLTILYGNKDSENTLFREELDDICSKTNKVKVVHVLSDEKKKGCENGIITSDLVKKYAEGNYSIFVCGPETMYRFLDKELKKLNLPKKRIRFEMLSVTKNVASQKGYPQEAKDKKFKITVKQGSDVYQIEASANEPVLVAFEQAGIKAPSCCRSGKCGWCKSRVLSGSYFAPSENDGRNLIEVLKKQIHPCATFPTSDMVIEVPCEH